MTRAGSRLAANLWTASAPVRAPEVRAPAQETPGKPAICRARFAVRTSEKSVRTSALSGGSAPVSGGLREDPPHAKDVCEALGKGWDGHSLDSIPANWRGMVELTTPSGLCDKRHAHVLRDAVQKLDDDEKDGVALTDAISRAQETLVVSESGLYALALRCRDAMTPGSAAL